jgi:predicted Kef-type K+ transport protein
LLGIGFRYLYRMVLKSALWWAWGGYIFLIAVKAESSVGFVFNWSVKAAIVMGMVLAVSPVMRRTLFPRRTVP